MTALSKNIILNTNFSNDPDFLADWLAFSQMNLPETYGTPINLTQYINAKNLACPMPLLKLKMALKNTAVGDSLYITATDPNSTQDIGAFCRHLGYELVSFTSDNEGKIFHHLVQKSV